MLPILIITEAPQAWARGKHVAPPGSISPPTAQSTLPDLSILNGRLLQVEKVKKVLHNAPASCLEPAGPVVDLCFKEALIILSDHNGILVTFQGTNVPNNILWRSTWSPMEAVHQHVLYYCGQSQPLDSFRTHNISTQELPETGIYYFNTDQRPHILVTNILPPV